MKKKFYVWLSVMAIIMAQGFMGCSADNALQQEGRSVEQLKFVISVDALSQTRAASDGKTDWSTGDQIIIAVNGDKNNLCMIEYNGQDWVLSQLSAHVDFGDAGRLNAVYADKITYEKGNIQTFGDILYFTDGKYVKYDDLVVVTLKMNQRPVAKIRVKGLPEGFWIDGLHEFSSLNIEDMTWQETSSEGELCSEKEGENEYTFYGILDEQAGNTTVKFVNEKEAYYSKTFVGKKMAPGDFISISGPLVSEDWEKKIPLEGLKAKGTARMLVGEKDNISKYFEFVPADATSRDVEYSSSSQQIVTIDKDGNMEAKAVGNATITIKSKEYGFTCSVDVRVSDITSYVSVRLTGVGTILSNAGLYYSRTYTIKNDSPVDIFILSMSTSNSISIDSTLKAGMSMEKTLYFQYNVSPTVYVTFEYNGHQYTISTN